MEIRRNENQYKMLLRCSKKKDMTEWNEWCNKNMDEEILLEGAYFNEDAHLEGAKLERAHLEEAQFVGTHLEGAKLHGAYLEEANLLGAHLEDTDFVSSYLEGANFKVANLHGAKFNFVFVNSNTSFIGCRIDRETDFRNVSLDTVRIKQETKQLLEYNARRKNWEEWYKGHKALKWLIKPFWWMSDYGRSTLRIILWFFGLALLFAGIYWKWPQCVMVNEMVGDLRGFWHALYFSVVTMTTLGFGDIAANPDSWGGQTLLMVQVILGYVLLGALVTRFAVLFTAGGPAGKFADDRTFVQWLFGEEADKNEEVN